MALWSAEQCAQFCGFTVDEWDRRVYSGQEPWPNVNDGVSRLWDSETVQKWRHRGLLKEGEWFSEQCAAFHGFNMEKWMKLVHAGIAPQPVRKIGARLVWNTGSVRRFRHRPERSTTPRVKSRTSPEGLLSAAEAAARVGMTEAGWYSSVRQERAPRPSAVIDRIRYWSIADVDELRKTRDAAKADRAARKGPDINAPAWTAKDCADFLGISPMAWRAAVRRGEAPEPSGYVEPKTVVWDPSCQRSLGCPGGRPVVFQLGGHQNSRLMAVVFPLWGQFKATTPLPARAWARRCESPLVTTRWA